MSQEKQQTTPEEVSSVRVLGRVSELPENQTQGKLSFKLVNPQTGEYQQGKGLEKRTLERYLPNGFQVKVGGPLPLYLDEARTKQGKSIPLVQDILFVDRGGDEACHWILASDTAALEVVLPIFAKKKISPSKEAETSQQTVNSARGGLWAKLMKIFSKKKQAKTSK